LSKPLSVNAALGCNYGLFIENRVTNYVVYFAKVWREKSNCFVFGYCLASGSD